MAVAVTATAHSSTIIGPLSTYAMMGCGTTPQYTDTVPGKNFLCSTVPDQTFIAGRNHNDTVYADGANDKVWAKNGAPNLIYGLSSGTAYIDPGILDCPVYGIQNVHPTCNKYAPRDAELATSAPPPVPAPALPAAITATSPPANPATPIGSGKSCKPNSAITNTIANAGWIGFDQGTGSCYYYVPPNVECFESDGSYNVLLSQTPRIAAVNANQGVVNWQTVAWSMIIKEKNLTTGQWQLIKADSMVLGSTSRYLRRAPYRSSAG